MGVIILPILELVDFGENQIVSKDLSVKQGKFRIAQEAVSIF